MSYFFVPRSGGHIKILSTTLYITPNGGDCQVTAAYAKTPLITPATHALLLLVFPVCRAPSLTTRITKRSSAKRQSSLKII